MTVRSAILTAVLSTLAVDALAQERTQASMESALAVGSRVRLRSTALQARPHGLVVALDESVVTLASGSGLVKVPLTSITGVETSLGRKGNGRKGLIIGAVAGLVIGLTAQVDPNDCGDDNPSNFCSRGEAVLGGSLVSAGMGAGIGALVKGERWSAVTLNLTRPQAWHSPSGLALSASVRF